MGKTAKWAEAIRREDAERETEAFVLEIIMWSVTAFGVVLLGGTLLAMVGLAGVS